MKFTMISCTRTRLLTDSMAVAPAVPYLFSQRSRPTAIESSAVRLLVSEARVMAVRQSSRLFSEGSSSERVLECVR